MWEGGYKTILIRRNIKWSTECDSVSNLHIPLQTINVLAWLSLPWEELASLPCKFVLRITDVTLSSRSTSAPECNRNIAQWACLLYKAQWRGVDSWWFVMSTHAPYSTRQRTHSKWPWELAWCSAVSPFYTKTRSYEELMFSVLPIQHITSNMTAQ